VAREIDKEKNLRLQRAPATNRKKTKKKQREHTHTKSIMKKINQVPHHQTTATTKNPQLHTQTHNNTQKVNGTPQEKGRNQGKNTPQEGTGEKEKKREEEKRKKEKKGGEREKRGGKGEGVPFSCPQAEICVWLPPFLKKNFRAAGPGGPAAKGKGKNFRARRARKTNAPCKYPLFGALLYRFFLRASGPKKICPYATHYAPRSLQFL
jgi:hypothetical protein